MLEWENASALHAIAATSMSGCAWAQEFRVVVVVTVAVCIANLLL